MDCAKIPLNEFEGRYPNEFRPRVCLERCKDWSEGKIKMPVAKRAILDCHAVAKEIHDDVYGAICHSIGHAGSTVHVKSHALGLPIYELTSMVLKSGMKGYEKSIKEKIDYYENQLIYWEKKSNDIKFKWADFLS
ncbi:hypothetical protein IWB18_10365 [Alkalibacter sp. M17DMB]|nr:hypothetical protein [Alkalibacter mobilis]